MSGCTLRQDQPQQVTWDLTGSPTRADVGWPAELDDTGSYHLPRGSTVTFSLPGEHIFTGDGVEVFVFAPGGQRISSIDVHSDPLTVDSAAASATEVVNTWGMAGGDLEQWRLVAARRARSGRNLPRTVRETPAPLGGGGPIMSLEMLNSFDPERPAILAVSFFWPSSPRIPEG